VREPGLHIPPPDPVPHRGKEGVTVKDACLLLCEDVVRETFQVVSERLENFKPIF
jgi:hypothetical protein